MGDTFLSYRDRAVDSPPTLSLPPPSPLPHLLHAMMLYGNLVDTDEMDDLLLELHFVASFMREVRGAFAPFLPSRAGPRFLTVEQHPLAGLGCTQWFYSLVDRSILRVFFLFVRWSMWPFKRSKRSLSVIYIVNVALSACELNGSSVALS